MADLHRWAEVCRAACDRHLDALAAVKVQTPLGEEAATVCRRMRKHGRRYHALNPLAEAEATLLAAVNRGEHHRRFRAGQLQLLERQPASPFCHAMQESVLRKPYQWKYKMLVHS